MIGSQAALTEATICQTH